jgi:O-antigen/teichoic acid export membrane protein
MTRSLLVEVTLPDESLTEAGSVAVPQLPAGGQLSSEVTRHIISGTSTLGVAVLIERGATFVGNILAARFAGASVFGAYSVGISTANNISTYAAGGIGATATRFSGKYSYSSGSYATFARVLGFVSLVSAAVAASALFFGAGPIAHILHKDSLTGLLRWASLSAAGMLILECARGFFVGQRRLAALALLSVLVGIGMVVLLPITAALKIPAHMVAAHGVVTLSAVILCLVLAKPLGLLARGGTSPIPFGAMLREVWGFGVIQLSGLLSANLAGWWITALVARGDTTLVQMGFFAIASQLRNLTGIVPALLTEGSYAVMATPDEHNSRVPQRVMALCTFASTAVAFVLASLGIIIVPWALRTMYGPRYAAAGVAAAIGMSVAVLQMGNAPPSARVSVVSIRSVAAINTLWAVMTAFGGTLLMSHWGGAAGAMLVFFVAHIVAALLTFAVLTRKDYLPAGLVPLFVLSTCGVAALSVLAVVREHTARHALSITAVMVALALLCSFGLYGMARKYAWLSALAKLQTHLAAILMAVRTFASDRTERRGSR